MIHSWYTSCCEWKVHIHGFDTKGHKATNDLQELTDFTDSFLDMNIGKFPNAAPKPIIASPQANFFLPLTSPHSFLQLNHPQPTRPSEVERIWGSFPFPNSADKDWTLASLRPSFLILKILFWMLKEWTLNYLLNAIKQTKTKQNTKTNLLSLEAKWNASH